MHEWAIFSKVAKPSTVVGLVLALTCSAIYYRIRTTQVPASGIPKSLWFALTAGVIASSLTIPDLWQVLKAETAPPLVNSVPTVLDWHDQVIRGPEILDSRDLRRSQFYGASVARVDFAGSNLAESDMRNSKWTDVNFAGVSLCGADIRGADLRNAANLDQVRSWAYVLYDADTRMPESENLELIEGPIPFSGHDMLYSCEPNRTRRIQVDGVRS